MKCQSNICVHVFTQLEWGLLVSQYETGTWYPFLLPCRTIATCARMHTIFGFWCLDFVSPKCLPNNSTLKARAVRCVSEVEGCLAVCSSCMPAMKWSLNWTMYQVVTLPLVTESKLCGTCQRTLLWRPSPTQGSPEGWYYRVTHMERMSLGG